MISYFNDIDWEIIYCIEGNNLRLDNGHVGHMKPHLLYMLEERNILREKILRIINIIFILK